MPPRLTFLLDVDNTLLDNDGAKADLAARLRALLGEEGERRFWEIYEAVRRERGMVNIPLTLARYEAEGGLMVAGCPPPEEGAERERCFALADLLMGFPYDRFLFPGALDAIAYLRRLGRVAILSDGDPTFQPSKIWRAGLDNVVDGAVLVFDHKEDHLDEVVAAFPADHFVLVDDKPDILTAVRARLRLPLTTVLLRRGRYAAALPPGPWPGADITLDAIADLTTLTAEDFRSAAAPSRGGGPLP